MNFKKNKDKLISLTLFIIFIIVLIIAIVSFITIYNSKATNNILITDSSTTISKTQQEVPNSAYSKSATQLLNDINVGINIGNSLDSCPNEGRNDGTKDTSFYETCWSNPVITKDLIKSIHNAGFNAIRLPVTWYYNTYVSDSGELIIRKEWLDRVAEIVDYCLDYDMYVILDSHHDEFILWADINDIDEVSKNASSLWSQIAQHFKTYDHRLVFESYNELNTKSNNWQYINEAVQATNILNQIFVDVVRKSGDKNSDRVLICSTYLNETTDEALEGFVLPDDTVKDRLAISVHSYSAAYNQDINSLFKKIQSFSKKHNAPVTITEFGTTDNFVPIEYRPNHASNYIACANEYNIKCFWWDDGGQYKIFDRYQNTILEPEIVDSLMNPAEFKTQNISTNKFNTIDNFSFASISSQTGLLEDFSYGALTLNLGKKGLPVIYGYGYHINLITKGSGDGMCLSGLAFYDSHQNLVHYKTISSTTTYDVTPPDNAAFMRITFYNPWGVRSLDEYVTYLESGDLSLEITEYIK